jgi:hypothetical protein
MVTIEYHPEMETSTFHLFQALDDAQVPGASSRYFSDYQDNMTKIKVSKIKIF